MTRQTSSIGGAAPRVSEGLAVDATRTGVSLRLEPAETAAPTRPFWARILSSAGGLHAWEQVLFDEDGVAFTPANGASSLVTGIELREVNGREGLTAGSLVRVHGEVSKPDDSGRFRRLFLADIGAGTRYDTGGELLEEANLTPGEMGSESEDTSSWDVTIQNETRGVKVPMLSRVVYDAEGSRIIYQFHRLMTFDANGHLMFIGPEVRSEVTTPVECGDEEEA